MKIGQVFQLRSKKNYISKYVNCKALGAKDQFFKRKPLLWKRRKNLYTKIEKFLHKRMDKKYNQENKQNKEKEALAAPKRKLCNTCLENPNRAP